MRTNCKLPFFLTVIGLFALPLTAYAALPYEISKDEVAMLPLGCQAKIGTSDDQTKKNWEQRLGLDNWRHLHHYCHGLKFINRVKFATNKQDRAHYLQNAIGEFDYVLQHWPADSPLRPEAQTKKNEVESMLKLP